MTNKIGYYKINTGVFFKIENSYGEYYINGVDIKTLQKRSGYYFYPSTDDIVFTMLKKGNQVRVGWELIDQSLASDKIPAKFTEDEVEPYWGDEDEDGYFWNNHSGIRSLYKEQFEYLPDEIISFDYELVLLGSYNIENISDPVKMTVVACGNNYCSNKIEPHDLSTIVEYAEIEKLLVPEFLLHERPCKLSSQQVYKIVRQYVKDNIDKKYARITSDYDFCFTVKKIIMTKPVKLTKEIKRSNGKSYAKPKFKTETIETKEAIIFEMTNSKDKYTHYPVIAGWEAKNLETMADQIKTFLDELIDTINAPLVECEHCGGTGHLINKLDCNKRDEI